MKKYDGSYWQIFQITVLLFFDLKVGTNLFSQDLNKNRMFVKQVLMPKVEFETLILECFMTC